MPEVLNILRALVLGNSRLVISSEKNRIRLEASRQVNGSKPQNATRTVSIGADNEELCTALVEIYFELRSIPLNKSNNCPGDLD